MPLLVVFFFFTQLGRARSRKVRGGAQGQQHFGGDRILAPYLQQPLETLLYLPMLDAHL